jgi:hypothetical protein
MNYPPNEAYVAAAMSRVQPGSSIDLTKMAYNVRPGLVTHVRAYGDEGYSFIGERAINESTQHGLFVDFLESNEPGEPRTLVSTVFISNSEAGQFTE